MGPAKSLRNQAGQGTVEYVLMLVVTVAIVMGLMSQFYKPFGEWTKFWLGDYVNCLLDRGDLPALMSSSGTDQCIDAERNFAAGKGPSASGLGGSGQTGRNSSRNSSTNADASGSGSSGFAGSSSRGGGSAGSDGPTTDTKKTKIAAADALPESQFYKINQGASTATGQGRRIGQMSISNLVSFEQEKLKRRESRIFKITSLDAQESGGRSNKVLRIDTKQRNSDRNEVEIEAWSFGKIFRLLLILIIIVFTIFFLFIQGVRIAKSLEKGN
jgi:hypothetical protein